MRTAAAFTGCPPRSSGTIWKSSNSIPPTAEPRGSDRCSPNSHLPAAGSAAECSAAPAQGAGITLPTCPDSPDLDHHVQVGLSCAGGIQITTPDPLSKHTHFVLHVALGAVCVAVSRVAAAVIALPARNEHCGIR